jgi:hypothetical protein
MAAATPAPEQLPNLFVVGAAKSGTTSLHRYLDAHAEISMSVPKEPRVFADTRWRERLGGYAEMFSTPGATIRGESSPRYTRFPISRHIPERVASTCPHARVIYIVRDPVDRIVADWLQRYAGMLEHRPLAAVLRDYDQPGNFYVAGSRYATQLEQWLRHFERERVLVIDQMDLRSRRTETLLRALRFLGVRPTLPSNLDTEFNVSKGTVRMTPAAARLWFTLEPATKRLPARLGERISASRLFPVESLGKPALPEETRAALARHLRGEAERLRELTGMAFASWSI